MELIYHYFTSPTKLYLIVCVGSGNTPRNYFASHMVMLSFIHHNIFLSNRMGLLDQVNFTLVRWLLTFIIHFVKYLKIIWNYTRDKPYKCNNCDLCFWLKWRILIIIQCYMKLKSFCFYTVMKILLTSVLSFSLNKDATPLYLWYRRGG